MSTSKRRNGALSVKHGGDSLPRKADLETSTSRSDTSATTSGTSTRTRSTTRSGSRWKMPNKSKPVTPKPFKDRGIRRRFETVREQMADTWNATPDDVATFITACQSPIERQFVTELVEEAGGRLERACTAAKRPDGWYLTISSPFRLQRRLHTSPWLKVYPQRPILTPMSDEKRYRQVDFFFEVCCDESPAGLNDPSCLQRFCVETEGENYHSGPRQRGRDHDRARQLRRVEVESIRFTGSQVNNDDYLTAAKALRFAWDIGTRPIK